MGALLLLAAALVAGSHGAGKPEAAGDRDDSHRAGRDHRSAAASPSHGHHRPWRRESPIVWEEIRLEVLLAIAEEQALAPRFLRLAWHSSGTYSPFEEPFGGSNGATMRFEPENSYGQNLGMQQAIDALEPIHARHAHEGVSVSDLWIFAAYVAVEHLEGPIIGFTPGRTDADSGGDNCPPEDRLPTWDESDLTIREIFGRLGLDDRQTVAIMGAHSVGRCHPEFSGFPDRHWDTTPQVLDNLYYGLLREPPAGVEWQEDFAESPDGQPLRFFRSYSWLMLPVDMLMREDPLFREHMEEFARFENLETWRHEFGEALRKVTELGLEYNEDDGSVRARASPCGERLAGPAALRGGDGGCPFAQRFAGRPKPAGHA